VTFNIHEGERFYVNRVWYQDAIFTKPYVVDRELKVRSDDDLGAI